MTIKGPPSGIDTLSSEYGTAYIDYGPTQLNLFPEEVYTYTVPISGIYTVSSSGLNFMISAGDTITINSGDSVIMVGP